LVTIDINVQRSAVLQLAESLDIPPSAYKLAIERYEAMARHLEREGSVVAQFRPQIYSQGSFQIGTVISPLDRKHGYDLDLACEMRALGKTQLTQQQLKQLLGREVQAYALAHDMQEPDEKPRCWHLDYQDDVRFHMDIVPSVPEDDKTKAALAASVAPQDAGFVQFAVAITDFNDANFATLARNWPNSNPKGYAEWFIARMNAEAGLVLEDREAVPIYERKSPLQIAIQILKQHRNVMFRQDPRDAPISCIITTLAARAYGGQRDLRDALVAIVDGMPKFIRPVSPRVANPVNSAEDFADNWAGEPSREKAFWTWHAQLQRDVNQLGVAMTAGRLQEHFLERFDVSLDPKKARALAPALSVPAAAAIPSARIENKPGPWAPRG
jgi:hypothetical protein